MPRMITTHNIPGTMDTNTCTEGYNTLRDLVCMHVRVCVCVCVVYLVVYIRQAGKID